MISNQREFDYARERIEDFSDQVAGMRAKVLAEGFTEDDVALANAPLLALIQDLEQECRLYERLLAGGIAAVPDYPAEERGKALIALRVACGVSQKELATRMGVSEAQVSRDERYDYQGITLERYARVLEVLGVAEHAGVPGAGVSEAAGKPSSIPVTIILGYMTI